MANGILKQLNSSLETTLRDSLDGLEDFTLQMAYASASMTFEILSTETISGAKVESRVKPVSLKLVDRDTPQNRGQSSTLKQRRA